MAVRYAWFGSYITCVVSDEDKLFAHAAFATLSANDKAATLDWLSRSIKPAKGILAGSTYSIKHRLQSETGVYIDNYQMAGAMLQAGLIPIERPCSATLPRNAAPSSVDFHGNWLFLCKLARQRRKKAEKPLLGGDV